MEYMTLELPLPTCISRGVRLLPEGCPQDKVGGGQPLYSHFPQPWLIQSTKMVKHWHPECMQL